MAEKRKIGWLVPLACVMLAIVALLGAYMGSYYALLDGRTFDAGPAVGGSHVIFVKPAYRVRGLDAVLLPAHAVDRRLRPNAWN